MGRFNPRVFHETLENALEEQLNLLEHHERCCSHTPLLIRQRILDTADQRLTNIVKRVAEDLCRTCSRRKTQRKYSDMETLRAQAEYRSTRRRINRLSKSGITVPPDLWESHRLTKLKARSLEAAEDALKWQQFVTKVEEMSNQEMLKLFSSMKRTKLRQVSPLATSQEDMRGHAEYFASMYRHKEWPTVSTCPPENSLRMPVTPGAFLWGMYLIASPTSSVEMGHGAW